VQPKLVERRVCCPPFGCERVRTTRQKDERDVRGRTLSVTHHHPNWIALTLFSAGPPGYIRRARVCVTAQRLGCGNTSDIAPQTGRGIASKDVVRRKSEETLIIRGEGQNLRTTIGNEYLLFELYALTSTTFGGESFDTENHVRL